jgi:serine/threonine-protein kinase RsbW
LEVRRVTGGFSASRAEERVFERTPPAVREIRRFVAELLGDAPTAEEAVLLVSELATNAVRYGAGDQVTVCVTIAEEIRIEVGDASPQLPAPLNPEGGHGRGLHILEAIATDWGAQRRDSGKVVWFTLPMNRRPLG